VKKENRPLVSPKQEIGLLLGIQQLHLFESTYALFLLAAFKEKLALDHRKSSMRPFEYLTMQDREMTDTFDPKVSSLQLGRTFDEVMRPLAAQNLCLYRRTSIP